MAARRWSLVLCFTLVACVHSSFAHLKQANHSDQKLYPKPLDTAYITISIDKLSITSPSEGCCKVRSSSHCKVCVYTCKFLVFDDQDFRRMFIDHQFDCSVETIGKKIRIPLLNQLSAPKIDVKLDIFTKSNDLLVTGRTHLYVENLEHEPESRILKINVGDRYDVNLNVSMSCVDGFVGPYCNISCTPPKIGEHHRCSPAGCFMGIVSLNPSTEQRRKYCESGYRGDNCTVPICTYGCAHGKCVAPNFCSCDPGWHGNRCEFCKPTDECPKPYYDRQGQRCKCPRYKPDIPGPSFENDLKRVDEEYRRRIRENDSTYLTLSVLIVVLLVICALLLVVVVGLTLRNSDFSFSCPKSAKLRRKTQPTESTPAPNIISV